MGRLAEHPFETLKLFLKKTSRKNFKWVGKPDELMIEKRNFQNELYSLALHFGGAERPLPRTYTALKGFSPSHLYDAKRALPRT